MCNFLGATKWIALETFLQYSEAAFAHNALKADNKSFYRKKNVQTVLNESKVLVIIYYKYQTLRDDPPGTVYMSQIMYIVLISTLDRQDRVLRKS